MPRGFLRFGVSVALAIAMVTAPGVASAQSSQSADPPRKSSGVKRAVWTLVGGVIGLGAGMTFGAIVFEDSLDSDRKAWTSAITGAAIGAFIGNVSSRNVKSSFLPRRQPGHGIFEMKPVGRAPCLGRAPLNHLKGNALVDLQAPLPDRCSGLPAGSAVLTLRAATHQDASW